MTDSKTYGLLLSSLYAPTPKFIFFEFESLLKASVTPKIGSGGPAGMDAQNDAGRNRIREGMDFSDRESIF